MEHLESEIEESVTDIETIMSQPESMENDQNKGKADLDRIAQTKKAKTKVKGNSRKTVSLVDSSEKPNQRRFVVNLKKESEEDIAHFNNILAALNDSPVGEVPFEEVVWYLVTQKLEESDYRRIRELAFERKIEQARLQYNKENKTDYSLLEFIAVTTGQLFE